VDLAVAERRHVQSFRLAGSEARADMFVWTYVRSKLTCGPGWEAPATLVWGSSDPRTLFTFSISAPPTREKARVISRWRCAAPTPTTQIRHTKVASNKCSGLKPEKADDAGD